MLYVILQRLIWMPDDINPVLWMCNNLSEQALCASSCPSVDLEESGWMNAPPYSFIYVIEICIEFGTDDWFTLDVQHFNFCWPWCVPFWGGLVAEQLSCLSEPMCFLWFCFAQAPPGSLGTERCPEWTTTLSAWGTSGSWRRAAFFWRAAPMMVSGITRIDRRGVH